MYVRVTVTVSRSVGSSRSRGSLKVFIAANAHALPLVRSDYLTIATVGRWSDNKAMSTAYSPVSVNWRGPRSNHGFLNQAYDPAQSFAYTSVYSGVRTVKKLDSKAAQAQVVWLS